ncbi:hypothetical protein SAMN02745146_3018 [Hymenobacter daecheongensis DSM 21074]|uniref:Uncharacterized protein n=1 Tax=Hymenobacter daecheongensis DSM 21074 TaxID=1121955 RepID=A0A1M6IY79_9BACT|nr:hypothetical protein [Hymenobacter daecheongensis]SHJ39428.1 hypothetical protein SAMN02745146_3018 [Hymenobacter daecheongensis DSM 21074]
MKNPVICLWAAALAAAVLPALPAPAQNPSAPPKVKPLLIDGRADQAGSDAKALALADRVMTQMGGPEAWQKARLLGWDFLDGSYQLWDKYTGDFHWQKGDLVANYNLNTKVGRAYKAGQDISATDEGKKLLDKMYPIWVNNSWWLVMPFKLRDPGVTLTHQGAGKLMDGTPAEVLHMTFQNVGVTPDNKYELLINPKTNLVEEWAYFPKAADAQPAFRRRWTEYRTYGSLQLAADRSDGKDNRRINSIAVLQTVPPGLMDSKVLVEKVK